MTERDKAIENLKKLIAEQKARIDPAVLAKAAAAAKGNAATAAGAKSSKKAEETVPYDREAAARAIELFMKNHGNAADFKEKLMRFLLKNSQ